MVIPGLLTSEESRKGIGYMLEAIVASLTILIFAVGSVSSPPGNDWNQFQNEIEAQDVGYVIEESGHLENFLERSEEGSMRTAAATLSSNMEISGTVQNLPIRRSKIGFHTLDDDIYSFNPVDVSSAPDNKCYENDDLEEINQSSEGTMEDIKRTENLEHGVYVYLADTDPRQSQGFNGEEDYDSIWVDNSTRCQFSSAEGPHYIDDFFFWGNKSDSDPDDHYDLKSMQDDGSEFTVYNATQVVRFRNTMNKPVNGIDTDTNFDTFTFSIQDLDTYNVIVFRKRDTLTDILDTDPERERTLEFLETGSALFLMDLEENDLDTGFMSETGMEWIDLDWTSKPSKARFSSERDSENVETYFLAQDGDDDSVSLLPGGNVSSGTGETIIADEKLAYSGSGLYEIQEWNATNMSMDTVTNPPPGAPESDCDNYREGNFEFPEETYYVLATELGNCNDDVWGLSVDFNDNGQFEEEEGPFVTGETLEVDNREYSVTVYPSNNRPNCDPGECAEFIFIGSDRIEIVNHRTSFEDRDIQRFARSGYESQYSDDERKLLASVMYWLAGDETTFGPTESAAVSTSVVGGVKNSIYMPYKVNMRWNR